MPLSLFIIYSIRNSCSHTIHLTCIQKRNPSCLSPTEHQNRVSKEILSLHIFSGRSLSCQSPHRELAHPKNHPGVESSVKIGMRRKTRAGNYNFYQQHPLSSIWATSKTTLSPQKDFLVLQTNHLPTTVPQNFMDCTCGNPCPIVQSRLILKSKLNILLQFDIKALIIQYITTPLVF